MSLAARIAAARVPSGQVALWCLAQAGFALKTSQGTVAYLDAYLTDACEHLFGYRRLIPSPIAPEEVEADLWLCTHAHADHLDPEALPVIARQPGVHFVGARDCEAPFQEAGLAKDRYTLLAPGESFTYDDLNLRATYADHADLAPDAIGLVIETEGVAIYNVGDSALRPAEMAAAVGGPVDIMISPINGAFGNMTAADTCRLAARLRPRLLIPAHYGMFAEHGSDPSIFMQAAASLVGKGIRPKILSPGEELRWPPEAGYA